MTIGTCRMGCKRLHEETKPMKKIYAYLNGGLGNQMFQYATARALALRTGAELVLDSWSGFTRDYEYQRSYELHKLNIQARLATAMERAPIWLFRTENKFRGKTHHIIQRRLYGTFLLETEMRFLQEISKYDNAATAWLVGYWQSPLYFQEYTKTLRSELMPPQPSRLKFSDLGKTMRETESVALSIRLYEESSKPAFDTKGLEMMIAGLNVAISRMHSLQPNAQFFVFCTHHSPIIEKLNLPKSTMLLTRDEGFDGTIDSLWQIAQCKHHIFTKSSYYWWGAWLSAGVGRDDDGSRHIFAEGNFNNQDGLYPTWQRF